MTCEKSVSSEEKKINFFFARSMFRLGKEGRGHKGWLGRGVRNDHDLAWSWKQVYSNGAKRLSFGFVYVGIARAEYLVDGWNGLGPKGQRGDRLGPSHPVNFGNPQDSKGGQQLKGDFSIGIRRCDHGYFVDLSNFCQSNGHDHRGNEGALPPRRYIPTLLIG